MASAPDGWLKANGAAISRTAYALLFAAIGTTSGAGDGVTTFNLPDLRGEFLRGVADGRAVDTGRVLGSAQTDDYKSHSHEAHIQVAGGAIYTFQGTGNGSVASTALTLTSGGSETRPRNVALLACIKY